MAECTISRCSHERRIFRKELQKWSKEILYILGLERLAEELMGVRKWKILVQPFSDLESKAPVDWYPEDFCYFCSAKKQPPYDPANGIVPTAESYSTLRIDTDEHSTLSDQGSFISYASALSPWQIATLPSQDVSSSPPLLDQPLDLSVSTLSKDVLVTKSKHSKHSSNHHNGNEATKSVLKVPHIPIKPGQKKCETNFSKRSYTEDELQAALRDIQSGKLGTRRAAVIYGIPRSTLRNKVYKLANESKSHTHVRKIRFSDKNAKKEPNKKCSKDDASSEIPVLDNDNMSSASESLRQLLKHTIAQKGQSSKVSKKELNSDELHTSSDNDAVNDLQVFGNIDYTKALSHAFSDIYIQHLALLKSKQSDYGTNQSLSALKDDIKLPLLPDLIRRLAEERIEFERDTNKKSDAVSQDEIPNGTLLSNVILKVPSFKPAKSPLDDPCHLVNSSPSPPPGTSSHSLSGNKGITVTLKELISRSVSKNVNSSLQDKTTDDDSCVDLPCGMANFDSPASNIPWSIESLSKDDEKDACLSTMNNSSNSSDCSRSDKRTRPKRGRYRNYDRDNLARAVRAVQKGEMSVHRAGTFYGVPHSTLEYKVKERHLLRPRKRDVFKGMLMSDTSEVVSASKSDNFTIENSLSIKNLKNNLNHIAVEASNGLSTNAEQPHRPLFDSYTSPLSLWQTMPFLALDFTQLGSNNFFASQMMRKLQENAILHEEIQDKRKGQDVGLIESLIKSTLERSVSPESKSQLLSTDSIASLSECKTAENIDEK